MNYHSLSWMVLYSVNTILKSILLKAFVQHAIWNNVFTKNFCFFFFVCNLLHFFVQCVEIYMNWLNLLNTESFLSSVLLFAQKSNNWNRLNYNKFPKLHDNFHQQLNPTIPYTIYIKNGKQSHLIVMAKMP